VSRQNAFELLIWRARLSGKITARFVLRTISGATVICPSRMKTSSATDRAGPPVIIKRCELKALHRILLPEARYGRIARPCRLQLHLAPPYSYNIHFSVQPCPIVVMAARRTEANDL
jgi:hypothetical protein